METLGLDRHRQSLHGGARVGYRSGRGPLASRTAAPRAHLRGERCHRCALGRASPGPGGWARRAARCRRALRLHGRRRRHVRRDLGALLRQPSPLRSHPRLQPRDGPAAARSGGRHGASLAASRDAGRCARRRDGHRGRASRRGAPTPRGRSLGRRAARPGSLPRRPCRHAGSQHGRADLSRHIRRPAPRRDARHHLRRELHDHASRGDGGHARDGRAPYPPGRAARRSSGGRGPGGQRAARGHGLGHREPRGRERDRRRRSRGHEPSLEPLEPGTPPGRVGRPAGAAAREHGLDGPARRATDATETSAAGAAVDGRPHPGARVCRLRWLVLRRVVARPGRDAVPRRDRAPARRS